MQDDVSNYSEYNNYYAVHENSDDAIIILLISMIIKCLSFPNTIGDSMEYTLGSPDTKAIKMAFRPIGVF